MPKRGKKPCSGRERGFPARQASVPQITPAYFIAGGMKNSRIFFFIISLLTLVSGGILVDSCLAESTRRVAKRLDLRRVFGKHVLNEPVQSCYSQLSVQPSCSWSAFRPKGGEIVQIVGCPVNQHEHVGAH
jgi:hypothetical protein